jgi:hypothetical protein
MTDGSPRSKERVHRYGTDIAQQLCILHVIKEVNKLIVDGGRAVKHRLKRQGHPGRKKRRGRPSKKAQQQQQYRKGLRKKEQATFLWDHQYLIVRKEEDRSEQEQQDLARRWQIAPARKLLRDFNQPFYRLFAKGMTKPCARSRRRRLVNHRPDQANAFLAKALTKLSPDKFDKMSVFLGWEKGERTNHHGERNNRVFRMMQKTRYKRRKAHTLEKALELELSARMFAHLFYQHNGRELPVLFQETAILEMAA